LVVHVFLNIPLLCLVCKSIKQRSQHKSCYCAQNAARIYEAKEAVSGIEKVLSKLKGKIIGICLATPIDITPRDQEKYVDGHEEPLLYLETELDNIEETLDDYFKDICTIKLIIKYWDGHKEG
jgi:hypothetical protein